MFSMARRVAVRQTWAGSVSPSKRPFFPSALRRLLSSLAILEQRDGKLNQGSLSAIAAAQKLGGPVHCFVAGKHVKGVAEEASKVPGVEMVVTVESVAYEKVRGDLLSSGKPNIFSDRKTNFPNGHHAKTQEV